MDIGECQEKVSWPDFLAWHEWLSIKLNAPDQLCYYLAQVACEVRRSYVQHPGRVNLDQFILKFENKARVEGAASKKILEKMVKAKWMAGVSAGLQKDTPRDKARQNLEILKERKKTAGQRPRPSPPGQKQK